MQHAMHYTTPAQRTRPQVAARPLNPVHRAHLATSALGDQVITERGYWTATPAHQGEPTLSQLANSQRHYPAIAIPVYRLGDPMPYTTIIRPDVPRMDTSREKPRPIKYEWPARVPACLDVLPRYQQALTDPSIPLWFTEGAKKADALASLGEQMIPISINGVWNWGKKNADGEMMLLPDFNEIPLRGRRVVLAFDSDYQVNDQVQMALDTFTAHLTARGAIVGVLLLPHLNDQKLGVDDALVQGWTFDELVQAIRWCDPEMVTGLQLAARPANMDLRQDNERLRGWLQWVYATLGNAAIPAPERVTAVFTMLELRTAEPLPSGSKPVRVWKIAQESGQSTDTIGRHLKKLEACGAWKRDVIKKIDRKTGALHSEILLQPTPLLNTPSSLQPPEPKNWGGRRVVCTECGSENMRARIYCADCGSIHADRALNPAPQPEIEQVAEDQILDLAVVGCGAAADAPLATDTHATEGEADDTTHTHGPYINVPQVAARWNNAIPQSVTEPSPQAVAQAASGGGLGVEGDPVEPRKKERGEPRTAGAVRSTGALNPAYIARCISNADRYPARRDQELAAARRHVALYGAGLSFDQALAMIGSE